jgi:hypothetical protein
MLLTKDNLLRFIREKKFVTPTKVAENFETTTLIASAILSEIMKNKNIKITNLKAGESPYYYDNSQKESLIEIGEKHLSENKKEMFEKLRKIEIVNDSSLKIHDKMAISKIPDFAIPMEIIFKDKNFKFWIWYLRDFEVTKKQIIDALKQREKKIETPKSNEVNVITTKKIIPKQVEVLENDSKKNIDDFFDRNNFKIVEKKNLSENIFYKVEIFQGEMKTFFECIYFKGKPQEKELINFYISSICPKIIFTKNVTKKLENIVKNFENLTLIKL